MPQQEDIKEFATKDPQDAHRLKIKSSFKALKQTTAQLSEDVKGASALSGAFRDVWKKFGELAENEAEGHNEELDLEEMESHLRRMKEFIKELERKETAEREAAEALDRDRGLYGEGDFPPPVDGNDFGGPAGDYFGNELGGAGGDDLRRDEGPQPGFFEEPAAAKLNTKAFADERSRIYEQREQELQELAHYLSDKIIELEDQVASLQARLHNTLSKAQAVGFATVEEITSVLDLVLKLGQAQKTATDTYRSTVKVIEVAQRDTHRATEGMAKSIGSLTGVPQGPSMSIAEWIPVATKKVQGLDASLATVKTETDKLDGCLVKRQSGMLELGRKTAETLAGNKTAAEELKQAKKLLAAFKVNLATSADTLAKLDIPTLKAGFDTSTQLYEPIEQTIRTSLQPRVEGLSRDLINHEIKLKATSSSRIWSSVSEFALTSAKGR